MLTSGCQKHKRNQHRGHFQGTEDEGDGKAGGVEGMKAWDGGGGEVERNKSD